MRKSNEELQSGVQQVFGRDNAFAALKEGGSVVAWGGLGGDTSEMPVELQSGVQQVSRASSKHAGSCWIFRLWTSLQGSMQAPETVA